MSDVTIQIRKNGPYRITGSFNLVDHDGNPVPMPEGKQWISLCRCGGSVTKPFCDGAHSRIGFIGAEEAVKQVDPAATPPSP
jgi:CDGSH-type Zn-finger protein